MRDLPNISTITATILKKLIPNTAFTGKNLNSNPPKGWGGNYLLQMSQAGTQFVYSCVGVDSDDNEAVRSPLNACFAFLRYIQTFLTLSFLYWHLFKKKIL